MARILYVASVGGHLTELLSVHEHLAMHETLFVINGPARLPEGTAGTLATIPHRTSFGLILSFFELLPFFRRFRPDVLVTNGAGHAVGAAIAARALGVPVVYLETGASVAKPSRTGRLIARLRLANLTIVPWESLLAHFPNAKWTGPLF